ncbi:DUF3810 domain-containing protein [Pedobacter sp. MW01-1-1]|uniref:DUF3810 domain-containing protein n=1 Tax=Pedobacter sp. MW01-1-1 TaxID=3383027 RepID=UPI003FEF09A4
MNRNKGVYTKFIAILLLVVLTFIIGFFPSFIQKYYSTGIYPHIAASLRFISSLFPFALGDSLYVLLFAFVLYKLINFYIRRKQLKKQDRLIVPLEVINFFLVLYILFKVVWGFNYSRPSVSDELGIGKEKYNVKELLLLTDFFIQKTNDLKLKQSQSPEYTIKLLQEKSSEAYALMAQENTLFRYRIPCLKAVSSTYLTSKAGIEGYYTPLSGEANINTALPNFVKPYVSCHEIAHQLGIAYEDEANLLGYLTANNLPNIDYQYSANYEMLRYLLFEVRMKAPQEYKPMRDKLIPAVLQDFKAEKEFWRRYNGQMFGYMDKAFDNFLKLNNQPKGIESYQDIVIWLWNIHKKEIVFSNKFQTPKLKKD